MPIRVLFFGATAAVTGQREIEMNGAVGIPAREIFIQLLTKFPEFSKQKLLLAVNQQYATGNEIVRDGDEVALFTAVSGG